MSPTTVTIIALRVLAIMLLGFALDAIPAAIYATAMARSVAAGPLGGNVISNNIALPLLIAGLRLGFAGALFFAAPVLARVICRGREEQDASQSNGRVTAADLYRIASFLLGVYVLLRAVRPAALACAGLVQDQSIGRFSSEYRVRFRPVSWHRGEARHPPFGVRKSHRPPFEDHH